MPAPNRTIPLDIMRPYGGIPPGHTMQMMVDQDANSLPAGTLLKGLAGGLFGGNGLSEYDSNNVIDTLLLAAVTHIPVFRQLTGDAIPWPVTLAVPHTLWEGTFFNNNSNAPVTASQFFSAYKTMNSIAVDSTPPKGFALIDDTTPDGPGVPFAARIINFVSNASAMRLNQAADKKAGAGTALWNVTFPQRNKGIVGDAHTRVIFCWNPSSTFV